MGNPVVGQPETFLQAWDFVVEIRGVAVGGFTTCDGLEYDHKVAIQRKGGENGIADVSNTTSEPKPITLKRGESTNRELYQWHANVKSRVRDIRDISIVKQVGGVPVVRYNCLECAMTSYKAGNPDRSKEEENNVEEITFQPKSWDRVDL